MIIINILQTIIDTTINHYIRFLPIQNAIIVGELPIQGHFQASMLFAAWLTPPLSPIKLRPSGNQTLQKGQSPALTDDFYI